MMAKINTKPMRLPPEIIVDIESALDKRYKNGLMSRKDFKFPEGMKLARRMPEWKTILKKIEILPKKEDLLNGKTKKR